MDAQPESETRTQISVDIPSVEEVMKRYNLTDPGVGYEMWRIVTRYLRYPNWIREISDRSTKAATLSCNIPTPLQDDPEQS